MKPTKMAMMMLMEGVLPFARSLDHIGPIARTVDDLRLLFRAMGDERYLSIEDRHLPPKAPVKLGRLRGFFDRRATPAVLSVLDEATRALAEQGADIVELDDPIDFEKVLQDHRTVLTAEAAKVHSDWLDEFPEDYPPLIRDIILEGRTLLAIDYFRAEARMDSTQNALLKAFQDKDRQFWITPAATSTAPDRATTGDPSFNAPWSYTGLPTVSFPVGLAPDGLPVSMQISGWFILDQTLLHAAAWCEQVIRTWRQ
jgi:aspartyl-tRNA(Asn)/glutamyl-tRNA(Gln) amidotransferase subunit A